MRRRGASARGALRRLALVLLALLPPFSLAACSNSESTPPDAAALGKSQAGLSAPAPRVNGEQPVWVFTSRSLPDIPGADIRFVRGDVRAVHREMVEAARGMNVWIVGGGDLAGQFHDAGLLDELHVQFGSVTLGAGKPLLPRRITQPSLTLLSVRKVGSGFAELVYAVPKPEPHRSA